jgi:hypothetical protein
MAVVTILHSPKVQLGLTNWYKNMLKKSIEKMPEGLYRNNHNGRMEKCSGIVMFASGEMGLLFKGTVCSLTPVEYNYKYNYVSLLTGPVAGTIDCRTNNISMAVNGYNEDLLSAIDSVGIIAFGRNIIVAYHSFNDGWEM